MLALASTPSGPDTVPTSRPLADCPKLVGTMAKKAKNSIMPIPFMIASLNFVQDLLASELAAPRGHLATELTHPWNDFSKENCDQIIEMLCEWIGLGCGETAEP